MINGIINIYKEAGFTSHDVVAKLRGIVKQKKIGHTGTLDPDAVGVLPVCFGNATKLCDMMTDKSKEYRACMRLGVITDTQDMSGKVLEERTVEYVTKEQVEEVINSFVGGYEQIPPMYSALKVNGKKLYELAREGKEIERKPRHVDIPYINIEEISLPEVRFTVGCSKGTYIRSLCFDIGEKLGCGAAMSALERTRVGSFNIADAHKLGEIEQMMHNGTIFDYVLEPDKVFDEYKKVYVKKEFEKVLLNGNKLYFEQLDLKEKCWFDNEEKVSVYTHDGQFKAVYAFFKAERGFKPFKMFL